MLFFFFAKTRIGVCPPKDTATHTTAVILGYRQIRQDADLWLMRTDSDHPCRYVSLYVVSCR